VLDAFGKANRWVAIPLKVQGKIQLWPHPRPLIVSMSPPWDFTLCVRHLDKKFKWIYEGHFGYCGIFVQGLIIPKIKSFFHFKFLISLFG
jgi:hypothetical protein